jgi:taurine transport system substrate-binding protein
MLPHKLALWAEEITVAYFLEWPMPFQYAKVKGLYDEALGMKVNWVASTGTAMSAAMASGDVQISVSQGVPPFVVATSAGQDLQMADIAVYYADNDNCVVKPPSSKSTRTAPRNSKARRSACRSAPPPITASSSRWNHFGVDIVDHGSGRHGSAGRRRGIRAGQPRHGLRLGRFAAPHEGARQRAAHRRREGRELGIPSST